MKRLCLFDLDGTLIDPHAAITTGVQVAMRELGVDIPDRNQINHFIGPPIRDSIRTMGNFTDEQIERVVDKYREYTFKEGIYLNTLYPGIVEMLEKLKGEVILTIATSKMLIMANQIAENLKFDHYFDLIMGCEPDGTRSRKSEVIAAILEKYDNPIKPVMIGDTKYDIIGAKETGISSIGVTWGYGSREEMQAAGADIMVDSMDELCDLLLSENEF